MVHKVDRADERAERFEQLVILAIVAGAGQRSAGVDVADRAHAAAAGRGGGRGPPLRRERLQGARAGARRAARLRRWPASSTRWPIAWNATARARWASCCRPSRPPSRRSTACPIPSCCSTRTVRFTARTLAATRLLGIDPDVTPAAVYARRRSRRARGRRPAARPRARRPGRLRPRRLRGGGPAGRNARGGEDPAAARDADLRRGRRGQRRRRSCCRTRRGCSGSTS